MKVNQCQQLQELISESSSVISCNISLVTKSFKYMYGIESSLSSESSSTHSFNSTSGGSNCYFFPSDTLSFSVCPLLSTLLLCPVLLLGLRLLCLFGLHLHLASFPHHYYLIVVGVYSSSSSSSSSSSPNCSN